MFRRDEKRFKKSPTPMEKRRYQEIELYRFSASFVPEISYFDPPTQNDVSKAVVVIS